MPSYKMSIMGLGDRHVELVTISLITIALPNDFAESLLAMTDNSILCVLCELCGD